jgi:hypothetical protein
MYLFKEFPYASLVAGDFTIEKIAKGGCLNDSVSGTCLLRQSTLSLNIPIEIFVIW